MAMFHYINSSNFKGVVWVVSNFYRFRSFGGTLSYGLGRLLYFFKCFACHVNAYYIEVMTLVGRTNISLGRVPILSGLLLK